VLAGIDRQAIVNSRAFLSTPPEAGRCEAPAVQADQELNKTSGSSGRFVFASISANVNNRSPKNVASLTANTMQQPNPPSPAGSKHQINQSIHLPTRLNFITP
jgi:hypothetical protein